MKYLQSIGIVLVAMSLYSQQYFNTILPQEENFYITKLAINNSQISLFMRSIVLYSDSTGSVGSKKIEVNENWNINTSSFHRYAFSRTSPYHYNGDYYAFADKQKEGAIALIKIDETMNVVDSTDYYPENTNIGVTASVLIDNHLYGAYVLDLESDPRQAIVNKYSLEGVLVWSKNISGDNTNNYCWEMQESKDGNLLLSADYGFNFKSYYQLIKLDVEGNEIWKFVDEAIDVTTSDPVWMAQLSNDNILLKTSENHWSNPEFIANDWYPYPSKLVWLTEAGEFIRDTLLTSPRLNIRFLENIVSGNGDYFYAHGRWEDPDTDYHYGWILKMTNDGEELWSKRYRYPEYDDNKWSFHEISHLVEYDNGDILFAGEIEEAITGETDVWIARINEYGCFGEDTCPDEVILSNVNDTDISSTVRLMPNPALDRIIVQSEYAGILSIYDINGRYIITQNIVEINTAIDIGTFPSGVFVYRLISEQGIATGKLVKK